MKENTSSFGIMYLLFPMIVQDQVTPLIFAPLKHHLFRPLTLTALLNYGTMFVS